MGPYRGKNGWKQQVGFEKVKTKVHTPDSKRERKHYEMQKQKQESHREIQSHIKHCHQRSSDFWVNTS